MYLKISSAKWSPICFGINVLTFTSRIFFSSAVSLIVTWIVCCWRLFGQTADNPGWNIFRKFRKSFFCFFFFLSFLPSFQFLLSFSFCLHSFSLALSPLSPPPFFLSSLLFPYCWVSLHWKLKSHGANFVAVIGYTADCHGGTTEEGNCSYLLPLSHRDNVESTV